MVVMKHVPKNYDVGLLIMRIGIAILFIYGGLGKLFGVLGGPGLEMFSGMVWGSMFVAVVVALAELVGGILVLIGFLSRDAKITLAVIILVANLIVHVPSGNLMNILVHLMLFTNLLGLALIGSGKYALRED